MIAVRDSRFNRAIDGFYDDDDGFDLSPKLIQLKELQRMTEIADTAIAARKRQKHQRVEPEGFGRKRKKVPIINRH